MYLPQLFKPFIPVALIILTFFSSCSKDEEPGDAGPDKSHFEVRLTDAPGNFTEVNIEIEQIRVHSEVGGWLDLQTNKGIYNLLDFANGVDTVVGGGSIPSGKISQIRFVLGSNNTVVVDGQTYPLKIPSGAQSGLKLDLHETLIPGIKYSMLVDFDVAQSIVHTGNGKYILKPVLHTIAEGVDGVIKGSISPAGVYSNIIAYNGPKVKGAVADSNGNFRINGLDEGRYLVCAYPASPYLMDTIQFVQVMKGKVTEIGIIQLRK